MLNIKVLVFLGGCSRQARQKRGILKIPEHKHDRLWMLFTLTGNLKTSQRLSKVNFKKALYLVCFPFPALYILYTLDLY